MNQTGLHRHDQVPSLSPHGIELIDREFFAAIKEGREPNSSVAQVLPAMETLDRIERSFG